MSTFYRVTMTLADNEDLAQGFEMTDTAGAPVDLTGAVLRMGIESAAGVDLLEASTTNGFISLVAPTLGQFEINVPVTTVQTLAPGVYRHDLIMSLGGRTQRIWAGWLTLSDGVTE